MNLDFAHLHQRYLTGKPGSQGWEYLPAHEESPGKDRYLSSYQVFSNNAVSLSLLIRNTIENGRATTAMPLLSLAFSNKRDGKYLLAGDPGKVVLPLYLEQAIPLFAALRGRQSGTSIDILRRGVPPKHLKILPGRGGSAGRYMASAFTTDEDGINHRIEVALGPEHVFHLQSHIVALVQLHYPWMEQRTAADILLSSAHPAEPSSSAPSGDEPLARQPEPAPPDRDRAQRAIHAIGVHRWPAGRRDVVRHIQESFSAEEMDRLIKAGNHDDWTLWDEIANSLTE